MSGSTTRVVVPASNGGDSVALAGVSSLRQPRATSVDGMPHGGKPGVTPALAPSAPFGGGTPTGTAATAAAPRGEATLVASLLAAGTAASPGTADGVVAIGAGAGAVTPVLADSAGCGESAAVAALECPAQPSAQRAPKSASENSRFTGADYYRCTAIGLPLASQGNVMPRFFPPLRNAAQAEPWSVTL